MPRDEPTLYDVRPDSARLSWTSAAVPGQPKETRNVRYTVESKALPDSDWSKVATGIHGNTFMVKQLRPNKEYVFRVRAENQFGESEPTQPAKLERQPEIGLYCNQQLQYSIFGTPMHIYLEVYNQQLQYSIFSSTPMHTYLDVY